MKAIHHVLSAQKFEKDNKNEKPNLTAVLHQLARIGKHAAKQQADKKKKLIRKLKEQNSQRYGRPMSRSTGLIPDLLTGEFDT